MDFKALMTKLETIDKKQVLTESEDRKPAKEKERDVTLPSGAKVKARTVQGWQSQKADKESDKEKKKNDLDEMTLRSSIAKELLKEFNIAFEEEAVEPEEQEQELDEAGEFQFSPEQEKWLGGANRQDPFILARMPGPKPPASYFTNPEDQAIVKQRFKDVFVDAPAGGAATRGIGAATKPADAAAPTGTQVQTDDEGNHMITTPDGKTMVVGPDGKPLPNGGKADAGGAATKPAAVDPAVAATREKFKALMDKLEKTGGVSGAAAGAAGAATKPAKKPATGAATKPAAKPTVGQQSMQQQAATAAGTDPNAVNPQGMAFGGGGLEEQTKLADDQILALIKGM